MVTHNITFTAKQICIWVMHFSCPCFASVFLMKHFHVYALHQNGQQGKRQLNYYTHLCNKYKKSTICIHVLVDDAFANIATNLLIFMLSHHFSNEALSCIHCTMKKGN